MHNSIANFLQMVTDSESNAIPNKYRVAYDLSIYILSLAKVKVKVKVKSQGQGNVQFNCTLGSFELSRIEISWVFLLIPVMSAGSTFVRLD